MERKVVCPHCKQPSQWENNSYRPFCSKRCKESDLGKWATEDFRIEGEQEDGNPPKKEEE